MFDEIKFWSFVKTEERNLMNHSAKAHRKVEYPTGRLKGRWTKSWNDSARSELRGIHCDNSAAKILIGSGCQIVARIQVWSSANLNEKKNWNLTDRLIWPVKTYSRWIRALPPQWSEIERSLNSRELQQSQQRLSALVGCSRTFQKALRGFRYCTVFIDYTYLGLVVGFFRDLVIILM